MRRTRRKRRANKAALKHGRAAKPRHMSKSGRTGGVHSKKTPPKKRTPYIGAPSRSVYDSVACPKCGARPGELHHH